MKWRRNLIVLLAAIAGLPVYASALQPSDAPWRLTLEEAQQLLSERNRDIRAAQRAVESAQADGLTAAQTPPSVFSANSTSINPSAGIGAGNLIDKRVDTVIRIDKPIERGGKRELRVAAADSGIVAARADAEDVARQQRLQLTAAYYDVKLAQEVLHISEETAALYQESERATALRLRAGDIAPSEANRLRVEALRARNDLVQAQAQLKRAQFTLAAVLSREDQAQQLIAADAWPASTTAPPAAQPDATWEQRADVRAAASRVSQAEAAFRLARAQASTDITVGVQYERFPPDGRNMYGVGISVPLFVGERQEGAIRRAGIDRAAADAALERTRAQAQTDLARARTDFDTAQARLARYESELLPSAQKAADAAEFGHQHGALGLLDVLDARRTLRAVRIEAEQAHADAAKAQAALIEFSSHATRGTP